MAGYTGGMALERAVVGALTHAELVDLVVRQSVVIDRLEATVREQQALIGRLEARIRGLERENREPRRANEILKAASAFFARELDPRLPTR